MLKSMYLGTSIAISWAWGTSLILGMEIARTKGIETFAIWATANCLTLAIFGLLYKKGYLTSLVLDQKIVRIFTNLIQIFCLIIQLKILNETFQNFFDPITSYLITAAFGIGLEIWMYRKGLAASIFSDLFQGIGTIIVMLVMAGLCLWNFEPGEITHSNWSGITWGIWSACILLSGIITDIQHWQRAEVNGKGYAFECAAVFFAIYLILVFLLSRYDFDYILNFLLLLAVIGVTTSTIDSIAVALHRDFDRKIGTLIGLGICLSFDLLVQLSVLEIWSFFGIVRVGLAIYILYWCYNYKNETLKRAAYSSI